MGIGDIRIEKVEKPASTITVSVIIRKDKYLLVKVRPIMPRGIIISKFIIRYTDIVLPQDLAIISRSLSLYNYILGDIANRKSGEFFPYSKKAKRSIDLLTNV